jgi:hypothetical protein
LRGPEVAAPSLDHSATDRYCAEELLILLINFMKKMKKKKKKKKKKITGRHIGNMSEKKYFRSYNNE